MKKLFFVPGVVVALSVAWSGCRPPPLMSYPYFWDHPTKKPPNADIAGTYQVEKVRLSTELSSSVREKDPLIKLNTDGTAIFTNVPILDGFGDRVTCRLTGSAIWELHSEFNSASGWSVDFSDYQPNLKPAQHECNRENSSWGML